jgi:hypothetical protein
MSECCQVCQGAGVMADDVYGAVPCERCANRDKQSQGAHPARAVRPYSDRGQQEAPAGGATSPGVFARCAEVIVDDDVASGRK